jgi:hypothetical protein
MHPNGQHDARRLSTDVSSKFQANRITKIKTIDERSKLKVLTLLEQRPTPNLCIRVASEMMRNEDAFMGCSWRTASENGEDQDGFRISAFFINTARRRGKKNLRIPLEQKHGYLYMCLSYDGAQQTTVFAQRAGIGNRENGGVAGPGLSNIRRIRTISMSDTCCASGRN